MSAIRKFVKAKIAEAKESVYDAEMLGSERGSSMAHERLNAFKKVLFFLKNDKSSAPEVRQSGSDYKEMVNSGRGYNGVGIEGWE